MPGQRWQGGKGDSRDTMTFVTSCPIGLFLPVDFSCKERASPLHVVGKLNTYGSGRRGWEGVSVQKSLEVAMYIFSKLGYMTYLSTWFLDSTIDSKPFEPKIRKKKRDHNWNLLDSFCEIHRGQSVQQMTQHFATLISTYQFSQWIFRWGSRFPKRADRCRETSLSRSEMIYHANLL